MAFKVYELDGIGHLEVHKRRRSKHLRITVSPTGNTKVSVPLWTPYATGLAFAKSKQDWIIAQQGRYVRPVLKIGDRIGKAHRITAAKRANQRISVSSNNIFVDSSKMDTKAYQQQVVLACERALRRQAKALLPGRLAYIAAANGFKYQGPDIKKLRSRWGSCSNQGQISLSLYLLQLPWPLIDYVLYHELVHTKHHNHSPDFWGALEAIFPNAKLAKKELKRYHIQIIPR